MRQNADTLIFRDAELAIKDRTQAGWKAPAFKLHHALLGMGSPIRKIFRLSLKWHCGHLRAAVAHHFFWAGRQQTSQFRPLAFDLQNFSDHRKEATLLFDQPNDLRHEIAGPMAVQEFNYTPHPFEGSEREGLRLRKFRGARSEKELSVNFSSHTEKFHRSQTADSACDPELRKDLPTIFDEILTVARAGNSLMITGSWDWQNINGACLISNFLADGRSVKVLGAQGSLDRIEALCREFMSVRRNVTVPMVWFREQDYLLFFGAEMRIRLPMLKTAKNGKPLSKVTGISDMRCSNPMCL